MQQEPSSWAEIRLGISELWKATSRSSHNYHASAISDARYKLRISTPHKGASWRKCPALECKQNAALLAKYEHFAKLEDRVRPHNRRRRNLMKEARERAANRQA